MNHQQSQPSAAPRLAGLSKDCDPCRRSLECTSKSYLAVIAITTLPPSVCAQGEREGSRCAIQVLYGLFSSCIGVKVRCRLVSHQPPPPWILLREAVTRTNNRLLQGHVRPMFVPNLPCSWAVGFVNDIIIVMGELAACGARNGYFRSLGKIAMDKEPCIFAREAQVVCVGWLMLLCKTFSMVQLMLRRCEYKGRII